MNSTLKRLGLDRTKAEIAKVRKQPLVYNDRTLDVLKKNWKTSTMRELCRMLNLEDTPRNRGRIQEALLRYRIRPKRKPYTKKELSKLLRDFSRKLGRVPVPKDLDKDSDFPSKGTYTRLFGSWNNAKTAAKL